MAKTYLATQTQVQAVETNLQTVETQISAPSTGIEPRLANVETNQAQVTTNKNDIATIRSELDDPAVGIFKQLTDIDTEINEVGTGIKARLTDLEQGGTSTMKFRTHSPSGTYEDGEVVQKDGSLYKSNSVIDGSVTPVPFALGTSGATWSALDVINGQYFTFNGSSLLPVTTNQIDLGDSANYFQGGYYQFVNFMSAANTNEGNIDADPNSLGIFGTTELALGHGNNNKDLTFTSDGLTLNKDLTVVTGKNIKFQDGDSTGKEGVNLRMNGNNLGFFGVLNGVEDTTPIAELTYDGKFSAKNITNSAAGYRNATSATYLTVCELGSLRIELNNAGGRIAVTDSTTHRFDWIRIEGASSSSGTGTASGNFTLNPPSSDGDVRSLIIGVNGTYDGVINVVMRKVSSTQLTMTASMVLSS